MNTLKYILILLAGALFFASCSDNNTSGLVSDIEEGDNLVAFTDNSQTVSNIADGEEYPVEVKMKLIGPSVDELSGDYTATIEPVFEGIPDNEQAEQGTHFKIEDNQITLSESNNYLGKFTFTMLTEGVDAPFEPQVKLKVTDVSGDGNVINSGKPIDVTFSYGCFSTLDKTYNVETTYTAVDGSVSNHTWTGTWTKTGVGTYRTERVGHWTQSALGGTPGMTVRDVCGNITIPEQNLVDLYANIVSGTGTVNETTGVISLDYDICFDGDCRQYEATYTPVP